MVMTSLKDMDLVHDVDDVWLVPQSPIDIVVVLSPLCGFPTSWHEAFGER